MRQWGNQSLYQTRQLIQTLAIAAASGIAFGAWATIPYTPLSGGTPGVGPGVASPSIVPGKEYSNDFDESSLGGGGLFDAQQILAWDGIGGVMDGLDFSGTRPTYTPEDQIDALANHGDHLYSELRGDEAHLVFSVDDFYSGYSFGAAFSATIPSAGPIMLGNGNLIGGAGELSVELGTAGFALGNPFDTQMLWAPQPAINGMPFPIDVDGVELWGPEPATFADTDKYSLDVDVLSFGAGPTGDAVSIWNGSGSAYIEHGTIVMAVTALLGGPVDPGLEFEGLINLDALMVRDVVAGLGEHETFDASPTGDSIHDEIIFSIRQILDPADPDGYYATGSELFVLDAAGGVSFLTHGGHLWDHAYSLVAFNIFSTDPQNYAVIDINAIEAISQGVVPEPGSFALLLVGVGLLGTRRRRR